MIKGKPEPITAYAAYDVGGSTGPARGAEEMAVIGREFELSALSDGLAKARAGMGCVVVIEGDAGIGKSTLVSRTADEASNSGMIVLAGGGDSTDQTTAYLAWRRVFLDLLERRRSDAFFRAAARRSSSPGSAVEPYNSRSGNAIIRLGAFARWRPSSRTCSDWKLSTMTRPRSFVGSRGPTRWPGFSRICFSKRRRPPRLS